MTEQAENYALQAEAARQAALAMQDQLGSSGQRQQSGLEILTGTLIGPHGQKTGRFVRYEDYHNLKNEVETLRAKLK